MRHTFAYLLRPLALSARNRIARRERGDSLRGLAFGGIGLVVALAVFAIVFWLTWQLLEYEDLGEYLVRLGLAWLFLTFLSFLSFSSLVVSLSTFFLSEDLWFLLAAPLPVRKLFHARFARTLGQASWMVIVFVLPVLLAIGVARCAGAAYYLTIPATVLPFVTIPVALGAAITLVIVKTFPARRARDILVLAGLFFVAALITLVRYLRPERLVEIESLPDVTAFFASLDNPATPLLPSLWAAEALYAALKGQTDWLHIGALWTSAAAAVVLLRMAFDKHYLSAWSKAQEARKARFSRLSLLGALLRLTPLGLLWRSLLLKDLKVFLRDAAQWSQLLLLMALAFVYLYSFRVLDPGRIPLAGAMVRSAYAFLNLALAAFVLSAVAVRFVFPAVSAEGGAFWLVRTAPVRLSSFLWSKFWSSLIPVLLLAETLTVVSNNFLRADPFLKVVACVAIAAMSFALVGLAAGMGAIYPRFRAENLAQIAGSYGALAFMVLAVLFILVEIALLAWPSSTYLWHQYRDLSMTSGQRFTSAIAFALALSLCAVVFWVPMQRGIRALEDLDG
jgi:ABC-2 type transport system permease protein